MEAHALIMSFQKPLFKKPKKKGTSGMSEYTGSELGTDASYLMPPYTVNDLRLMKVLLLTTRSIVVLVGLP